LGGGLQMNVISPRKWGVLLLHGIAPLMLCWWRNRGAVLNFDQPLAISQGLWLQLNTAEPGRSNFCPSKQRVGPHCTYLKLNISLQAPAFPVLGILAFWVVYSIDTTSYKSLIDQTLIS
jgi:hypothetical protein